MPTITANVLGQRLFFIANVELQQMLIYNDVFVFAEISAITLFATGKGFVKNHAAHPPILKTM